MILSSPVDLPINIINIRGIAGLNIWFSLVDLEHIEVTGHVHGS